MIRTSEASLGEEMRTSLKAEGSTREAGDPRSKMKSMRVNLGRTFCFAFVAPIVGYRVIKSVRLAIGITVVIFNFRAIREK